MQIPQQLLQAVASRQIVPFVGSGVSMDVSSQHFCSWDKLLQQMVEAITDNDDKGAVRSPLKKGRLLEAAEQAYEILGASEFRRIMLGQFRYREPVGDLTLPKAIWALQPQRVITTNYDRVLQWANPKSQVVLSGQSGNMQEFLNPQDNPMVWHLHGHVDDSDTLVLTKSQYTELYSSGDSGSESSKRARFTLQSIWAGAPLLFIGFGLRDRYVMDSLLRMLQLFGGHARERFVLMCEQDHGQVTAWDDYRITPVRYAGHGEPLRQLLQQIQQQSEALRQANGSGQHAVIAALPLIPARYGQWLESDCRDVLPFGMEQKQQLLMHLRQVYVPALVERQKTELQSRTATKTQAADSEDSPEEPDSELLMAAIQQGSLLVEGDPGAGKSTFCRWLCLRMMCELSLQELVETPEEFREQLSADLRPNLLVVRVPLRELNDQLCAERRNSLDVEQLQQMLGQCLDRYAGERGLQGRQLLAWLQAGRVLLLLDGVDEVPVEQGAGADCWQPRQVLLECLPSAVRLWLQAGNRVLITSRPHGVPAKYQQRLQACGLRLARLQPLPAELQDLLARRWFSVMQQSAEAGCLTADAMLTQVRQLERVQELVPNPLLLTAICIIYGEGKVLPQDLHALYDRIIKTSLHAKYSNTRSQVDHQRGRLVAIARGMHLGIDESRTSPVFEEHSELLKKVLSAFAGRNQMQEQDRLTVVQTLEDLLNRSGLLRSKSDDSAEFAHASFQEFLAAEALGQQAEGQEVLQLFLQHGQVSNWRNTLQFLFARRVAVHGREKAEELALQLVQSVDLAALGQRSELAVVACDVVSNLLDRGWQPQQQMRDSFTDLFAAAVRLECSEPVRIRIALLEGRLGDRRPELRLENAAAWCVVRAGRYFFGEDSQPWTLTDPFEIGRFPVTNAQYRRFVEAGGYLQREYWSDAGWAWREEAQPEQDPAYLRNPHYGGATQPVASVSWWEAEAFCRWCSAMDTRYQYFLPTEEQWEAAARGGDDRRYPWGDDWRPFSCNSEKRNEAMTPVGLYPAGAAPCGAEELAGNVWEWTGSVYDRSEIHDPNAGRVLRGGSWFNDWDGCSAWWSFYNAPVGWSIDVGFRLARTLRPDP